MKSETSKNIEIYTFYNQMERKSMELIAEKFGMSRQRVQQILLEMNLITSIKYMLKLVLREVVAELTDDEKRSMNFLTDFLYRKGLKREELLE